VNNTEYFYLHVSLLLGAILFSVLCGIFKFRTVDFPAKILCVLLGVTFLNEITASVFAIKYHNNLSVYSIFNIVQFVLLAAYFNFAIDVFRKSNIGLYIGIAGMAVGILNIVFLEPLGNFNTNFLLFEALCIIAMALFFFFRLLLVNDNFQLHRYPHFWFSVILVFFWSASFLCWGLYDYYIYLKKGSKIISYSILAINLITYIAIGISFLSYHKMTRADGK